MSFLRGFGYVIRGAKFVYLRHPALARIWFFPVLLTACGIATGVYGGHTLATTVVESFWATPTGEGFWVSVLETLHTVVEWLTTAIFWVLAVVLMVSLASVIASPFNDSLSEAVERLSTGEKAPPFSLSALIQSTGRTIRLELMRLVIWAGVMGPLLCASFAVPGVGQLIYTVFGYFFTALYLALDYIDWPAERQNKASSYRMTFIKRRFALALGFGSGVFLLLFIPVLNLFFMPAAVAGGTLLFLDLEGRMGATKVSLEAQEETQEKDDV